MTVRLKNTIKRIVKHLFFRYDQVFTAQRILEKNFFPGEDFCFVQVGAHDGRSFDSLYEFNMQRNTKGLAIEPIAEYYNDLVKNYAYNQAVQTIQMAVHATSKQVTMYRVDPQKYGQVEEWKKGIASIYPDHHKRSATDSSVIIKERVKALPFMDILEENGFITPISLLQIDVEGYDYEVLKQIDFSRIHPAIIKYEYISLQEGDTTAAKKLLSDQGYYCFEDEIDVVAVDLSRVRL